MLKENIKNIHKEFNFATDEDRRDFNNALNCLICKGSPNEDRYAARPKADKARDHCHFTGKYRGAAHYICSLQFEKLKFTPVIFHNLAGSDSHLLVKNLGKSGGNIKCVPNNEEKYMSFSKDVMIANFSNK